MSRPLLSLCVIARDEEQVIARCLGSARPYVDEVVVVDTGSADATPDLAREHGARVLRSEWQEDFARARNEALAAASGAFVLMLDADEWIETGPEPAALRANLESADGEAFTVEMIDSLDGGATRNYPLLRLFRNRPEHRYTGAIHEQIGPSIARRLGVDTLETAESALVVGHDGYGYARRSSGGKSARNLGILRRSAAGNPEDVSIRYYLARELVPMRGGRAVPGAHVDDAVEHLRWVGERSSLLPEPFAVDADRLHAAALLARGSNEEGWQVLARCPDRGVACDLLRADAAMNQSNGDYELVREALDLARGCFDRPTRDRGPYSEPALAGPIARARAAEALVLLGLFNEARDIALEGARMKGGGAAPWNALANLHGTRDEPLESLRAYLEGIRCDPLDPWAWAGLGETFLSLGRPEDALDPLSKAATLAPGWDRVDEALASAFLMAGRSGDLLRFYEDREEGLRAGAQAGVILGAALEGTDSPVAVPDPSVPDAIGRILQRLGGSGRRDLLTRLGEGLRKFTR